MPGRAGVRGFGWPGAVFPPSICLNYGNYEQQHGVRTHPRRLDRGSPHADRTRRFSSGLRGAHILLFCMLVKALDCERAALRHVEAQCTEFTRKCSIYA